MIQHIYKSAGNITPHKRAFLHNNYIDLNTGSRVDLFLIRMTHLEPSSSGSGLYLKWLIPRYETSVAVLVHAALPFLFSYNRDISKGWCSC